MKKIFIIFFLALHYVSLEASENFKFYLQKAISNNLELNAERKNLESIKQDGNISRSEFLPSITILATKLVLLQLTELIREEASRFKLTLKKNISLEQVIFSGFGVNTFKNLN